MDHLSSSPAKIEEEETTETPNSTVVNLAPAAAREDEKASSTRSSNNKMLKFDVMSSALDKSIHNTMKRVSKSSSAVREKAAAYVEKKTMVSRAATAILKSIPEVEAQLNGDQSLLEITKRFQQGPVTVLKVLLKPAALPHYIDLVEGEYAAENFNAAKSTLKLLGATDTVVSLEREMLPRIRKGLMKKVSSMMLSTMKEKEGGSLEVDCIALEEPEEATWLFTFMEFHAQMK